MRGFPGIARKKENEREKEINEPVFRARENLNKRREEKEFSKRRKRIKARPHEKDRTCRNRVSSPAAQREKNEAETPEEAEKAIQHFHQRKKSGIRKRMTLNSSHARSMRNLRSPQKTRSDTASNHGGRTLNSQGTMRICQHGVPW